MSDLRIAEGPACILVVQDHDATRAALAEVVRLAFPGYRVLESGDAAGALSMARRHCAVLAIIEEALPDMDAMDVLARLRAADPALDALLIARAARDLHEELVPAIARALESRKRHSH